MAGKTLVIFIATTGLAGAVAVAALLVTNPLLSFASLCASEVQSQGVQVVLTRQTMILISLTSIAGGSARFTLFIGVHEFVGWICAGISTGKILTQNLGVLARSAVGYRRTHTCCT